MCLLAVPRVEMFDVPSPLVSCYHCVAFLFVSETFYQKNYLTGRKKNTKRFIAPQLYYILYS